MLEGLIKGKFFNKCKLAARMAKARLEIIKKKRIAMQKFLKNDIADLLKNGLDKNAFDRAEGYLVEQNLTSCYEFVEKFCLKILDNVLIMSKQSECPGDCHEAVSSLIFAAARFADLPDLRELRSIFTNRYGTSLDSYVNKEFANKLKLVPPTKDMKLQLMQDIAEELGVQWDRYAAEEKLFNHPPQDFKQVNNNASARRNVVDRPKTPEERTPFRNFPREAKKVAKENVEENENLEHNPIPPPPYRRSNVDQIRNNDEGRVLKVNPVGNSQARPISVRRRLSKLNYNEDDVGVSSARKEGQDSNNNEPDEEEQLLDKMLIRHSLKKSTLGKSGMMRHGSRDVDTKEETKKVPDYDDLVARLAAFREDI